MSQLLFSQSVHGSGGGISCGCQSSSEIANKPNTRPALALEANELFFLRRNKILLVVFFVNAVTSPFPA